MAPTNTSTAPAAEQLNLWLGWTDLWPIQGDLLGLAKRMRVYAASIRPISVLLRDLAAADDGESSEIVDVAGNVVFAGQGANPNSKAVVIQNRPPSSCVFEGKDEFAPNGLLGIQEFTLTECEGRGFVLGLILAHRDDLAPRRQSGLVYEPAAGFTVVSFDTSGGYRYEVFEPYTGPVRFRYTLLGLRPSDRNEDYSRSTRGGLSQVLHLPHAESYFEGALPALAGYLLNLYTHFNHDDPHH